ncbi:hypothetical protein KIPB_004309 [Kipferlia bialata]|uniref:Uncharacterized protein n=1 Tax=Kipferlia bialata TaxID=797122 RepID=A0A9K3CUW3_9EUKA|nr:hypothetical protein KIPB_004309 [Kipferlia bialata]|eukprot:g4309.t1
MDQNGYFAALLNLESILADVDASDELALNSALSELICPAILAQTPLPIPPDRLVRAIVSYLRTSPSPSGLLINAVVFLSVIQPSIGQPLMATAPSAMLAAVFGSATELVMRSGVARVYLENALRLARLTLDALTEHEAGVAAIEQAITSLTASGVDLLAPGSEGRLKAVTVITAYAADRCRTRFPSLGPSKRLRMTLLARGAEMVGRDPVRGANYLDTLCQRCGEDVIAEFGSHVSRRAIYPDGQWARPVALVLARHCPLVAINRVVLEGCFYER